MEAETILDAQISANSEYNANHGAVNARLDLAPSGGQTGGWSAASPLDINKWIQVDLETVTTVSGLIIQGRQGANQWVTKYKVQHSNDEDNWQYVQDDDNIDVVS